MSGDMLQARYRPEHLQEFASDLLSAAGLDQARSRVVSEILLESDLLGQSSHGLALLPRYLQEIGDGGMSVAGDPEVISDRGACVSWDGRKLPGMWLTSRAIDLAIERVGTYGTVTIAVGNSHHIGCLGAYLQRATSRGYLMILAASVPSSASVAPFGGRKPVLSPNPIAVGIPTNGTPILVDVSMSITTNNVAARMRSEGRRYPHEWLLDAEGTPSNDPQVMLEGGSILPAGGLDHGQKGYGLALMVEALTQGLSGFGRSLQPKGWNTSFMVQLIDPSAFGGSDRFLQETSWVADACSASPGRSGQPDVRLPGARGLQNKERALQNGISVSPDILNGLQGWAEKFAIRMPTALAASSAA